MITQETEYIKNYFLQLGRDEKSHVLQHSSLTDHEIDLLTKRLINGMSLKDCADFYCQEINTVSKRQTRAIRKLFAYIND